LLFTTRKSDTTIHPPSCGCILTNSTSKIIIDTINSKIQAPWQVDSIIKDIKALMETTTSITFHHIFCEVNVTADWMAWFGHSITSQIFWTCSYGSDFSSVDPIWEIVDLILV